jgi:hypothetical protein
MSYYQQRPTHWLHFEWSSLILSEILERSFATAVITPRKPAHTCARLLILAFVPAIPQSQYIFGLSATEAPVQPPIYLHYLIDKSTSTPSVPSDHEHLALLGEGGQGTVSRVHAFSNSKVGSCAADSASSKNLTLPLQQILAMSTVSLSTTQHSSVLRRELYVFRHVPFDLREDS